MVILDEVTVIHAPIERCFDLARSIDLRVRSAPHNEEVIAGVTSGLIGIDQEVVSRIHYLGRLRDITLRVSRMDSPRFFQEQMVRGPFRSFEHDHVLAERGQGLTAMRDSLRFEASWLSKGPLRKSLLEMLKRRNEFLVRVAESDEWTQYLPAETARI